MLLGACTQASLALLVRNKYYAFLPAAILLSFRMIDALLIHFRFKKNPFLQNAILKKRFSAVVPDRNGKFEGAGLEKVVILLLGAKSNHPFGFFAPEFLKTFKWMAEMNSEFDKQDGPDGCKFSLLAPIIRTIVIISRRPRPKKKIGVGSYLNIDLSIARSSRSNGLAAQRRARRHGIRLHKLLALHRLPPRLRTRPRPSSRLALVGEDDQASRYGGYQS